MANLLSKGAQYLKDSRTKHLTEDITYEPKAGGSHDIKATLGAQTFVEETVSGAELETKSKDFLINSEDIPSEPEEGDKITYNGRLFEVNPFGDLSPWAWSDSFNRVYRIHTKEIHQP